MEMARCIQLSNRQKIQTRSCHFPNFSDKSEDMVYTYRCVGQIHPSFLMKAEFNWGPLSSTFHVGPPETLTDWKSESITYGRTNGQTDRQTWPWVGACLKIGSVAIFRDISISHISLFHTSQ